MNEITTASSHHGVHIARDLFWTNVFLPLTKPGTLSASVVQAVAISLVTKVSMKKRALHIAGPVISTNLLLNVLVVAFLSQTTTYQVSTNSGIQTVLCAKSVEVLSTTGPFSSMKVSPTVRLTTMP